MSAFKWTLTGIAAVVVLWSLCFGLTWMGLKWKGFFGPRFADVERTVFLETRSYNQGMIQQLSRYRLQYALCTTPEAKAVIKSTVRTMFSEYPPEDLPSVELRTFHQEMMNP